MSFLLPAKRLLSSPKNARSIWTALTSTGSNIDECIQVSIASLPNSDQSPDVCVVLASKSFSLKHYHSLTEQLSEKLGPSILVGGVIDRVPQFDHGISLWLGYDEKVVPITIQDSKDRHKVRSISVGRWGRSEDRERIQSQNDYIDKVGLKNLGSVSTPVQHFQLPPGLDKNMPPPSFIFTISDNEPDELLQTLDHHYPSTPKLGIVGASTPFVTGEPYTLFSQNKIMGSGIVGFAAYGKDKKLDISASHLAMEKLGKPVKITRCRGNIILDLDEGGATGLLLKLIKDGPITKDEEFYLAVYPPNGEMTEEKVTVSRITSGDPSRGNMSVDTTAELEVGQTVQFLRKKDLGFKNVSSDPVKEATAVFGVSGKDHTIDATLVKIPDEASTIHDLFGGVSENGIILGRKDMPSEILDAPYSRVTLRVDQ